MTVTPQRAPPDSLELVALARSGDVTALNDLLKRHAERLARIVRVRLGWALRRHVETADIVQETLLVATSKIAGFEPRDEASVLKWLAAIALNQIRSAHDRYQSLKRGGGGVGPSGPEGLELAQARDAAPHDQAARDELTELIDEALSELPEHYREAVVLRDLHGGSWAFVARELGAPSEDAAMKIYHRAWIRLRRALRGRIREP